MIVLWRAWTFTRKIYSLLLPVRWACVSIVTFTLKISIWLHYALEVCYHLITLAEICDEVESGVESSSTFAWNLWSFEGAHCQVNRGDVASLELKIGYVWLWNFNKSNTLSTKRRSALCYSFRPFFHLTEIIKANKKPCSKLWIRVDRT